MNPSRATIPLIRPHQCDSEGGRIRGVLLYNPYFWYVTALQTILNGYALFTTMGVQVIFMDGRMLKKLPILTCPDQTFIS